MSMSRVPVGKMMVMTRRRQRDRAGWTRFDGSQSGEIFRFYSSSW